MASTTASSGASSRVWPRAQASTSARTLGVLDGLPALPEAFLAALGQRRQVLGSLFQGLFHEVQLALGMGRGLTGPGPSPRG